MPRLKSHGPDIWSATHHFKVGFFHISSRMTVVRLEGRRLWLHSPIRLSEEIKSELAELGEVCAIVAPNKMHHLFLASCAAAYPQAKVYAAPGLVHKRPDLSYVQTLETNPPPDWAGQLDQQFIEGIPIANETLWFHRASGTLIVTDLVQCWEGELARPTHWYARATGVRQQLAMPYTVRALVRDRAALRRSCEQVLAWPIERVLLAHNAVIEIDAHARLRRALMS